MIIGGDTAGTVMHYVTPGGGAACKKDSGYVTPTIGIVSCPRCRALLGWPQQ